jgi:hypothetical protein
MELTYNYIIFARLELHKGLLVVNLFLTNFVIFFSKQIENFLDLKKKCNLTTFVYCLKFFLPNFWYQKIGGGDVDYY